MIAIFRPSLIHAISGFAFTCIILSCNDSDNQKKGATPIENLELDPKYCGFYEMSIALNREDTSHNGNIWRLVESSDCNCRIKWISNGVIRETKEEYDFYTARHFHESWENEDFLVLRAHGSSDTWFEVYLPLKSSMQEFEIENPLAHDANSNLVVFEDLEGDNQIEDTIMRVVHLLSQKRQNIIERSEKCVSILNHYCIDSVSISNDMLRYHWTTPDRIGNKNFKVKSVKLRKLE